MSRRRVVGIVASALLALGIGLAALRHGGAELVVTVTPRAAPAVPAGCDSPCRALWAHGWFHAVAANHGGRSAYLHCDVQGYDRDGKKVFSGYLPFAHNLPAGPEVAPGATESWDWLLPTAPSGPVDRFVTSCVAVDYHGNPPV